MTPTVTQQAFLLAAMAELGRLQGLDRSLTREEMCARLGCPPATFNKWMLASANGREMPPTVWFHVREVIAHDKLKVKLRQALV